MLCVSEVTLLNELTAWKGTEGGTHTLAGTGLGGLGQKVAVVVVTRCILCLLCHVWVYYR